MTRNYYTGSTPGHLPPEPVSGHHNSFDKRLARTLMTHNMGAQGHMGTNTDSPKYIWVNVLENRDEDKGGMVLIKANILPCEGLDPIFTYKIYCGYSGDTFVTHNGDVYNTVDTSSLKSIVKYKLVGKVYL